MLVITRRKKPFPETGLTACQHKYRLGQDIAVTINGILVAKELTWHCCLMKIIIEKHPEGYVGYPAGIQGVVVGQGKTYEDALRDVQSALRFHIETFGREALESERPTLD